VADRRYQSVERAGAKFWKVLAGAPGPVAGKRGPLFRYQVFVEKGLVAEPALVAGVIERTLRDNRGWTRGSVRFQRVAEGADTDVYLARPDTVDKLCVPLDTQGEVSCCVGRNVVFNWKRWKHAVPHWRPDAAGRLRTYREMVINHEFGHRIGNGHRFCPYPGARAPVMQQQTYGLQGCLANPWPLESELL